jgi:AcrR family transcriptional regulator
MGKTTKTDKDRPRRALSRARIVKTALGIVDREGLDALSMRRLGDELGVVPMAIYYHIPNKAALYDGIVEAVMSEIDLSQDDPAASFESRLLTATTLYRDVMLAHVNALPVLLSRGPSTPESMRPVDVLLGIMRAGGLGPTEAMSGVGIAANLVRGFVAAYAQRGRETEEEDAGAAEELMSLPPDEYPNLLEVMSSGAAIRDMDADFTFAIKALARGLAGLHEGSA